MNERIVESISGYQPSFQLAVAIPQPVFGFPPYAATVEALLRSAEGGRIYIRYPRIRIQVKALQERRFYGSRSAQTVESIDYQDCSFAFLCLIG